MKIVRKVLGGVLYVLATPLRLVRLVREGDSDVEGTYPDRQRLTAEQIALQGSVTNSFVSQAGMNGF